MSNIVVMAVMDQTAELYKEDPCQCPEPTTMMPFWNEPKDKWPTSLSVTGEVRRGAVGCLRQTKDYGRLPAVD